jgi:hypothetical protein
MGKGRTLFEILKLDERAVLEVLEKHGVYFDAGTYITLSAPLEKVAAYHAVPDAKAFIRDLEKALKRGR